MSTALWCVGFVLMLASFTFLFGQSDEARGPRISVEPWWPERNEGRPA
jgi:hypothetical protein